MSHDERQIQSLKREIQRAKDRNTVLMATRFKSQEQVDAQWCIVALSTQLNEVLARMQREAEAC